VAMLLLGPTPFRREPRGSTRAAGNEGVEKPSLSPTKNLTSYYCTAPQSHVAQHGTCDCTAGMLDMLCSVCWCSMPLGKPTPDATLAHAHRKSMSSTSSHERLSWKKKKIKEPVQEEGKPLAPPSVPGIAQPSPSFLPFRERGQGRETGKHRQLSYMAAARVCAVHGWWPRLWQWPHLPTCAVTR